MNKSNRIVPALLIAVGIVLLGLFIKQGINNLAFNNRAVTVRGLATREVKADKVTWPLVSKTLGNELVSLYDVTSRTNDAIIKWLTDNGIPASEISANAPSVFDRQAQEYGSNDGRPRFTLTSVIVVSSANVDKVSELIKRQGELLKQGISLSRDYSYSVEYEFTGLNEIKPSMIAEATAQAREAADKFAEDSHSKLGQIKTASQGQFTIEDRDSYTPQIKTVRVVNSITYYLED
ncbi:MAG: SIMPL domain-containing protein [Muribaculaceae bacterium]|nr:SIMPL domain-containing protein [Muribaculaceae bacterium]